MIRLERITLREIQLPLIEPFRTVHGEVNVRRILLLELVDATGARMWSECVAQSEPGYSRETVDSCWLAIHDVLAKQVLGHEIRNGATADSFLRGRNDAEPMARAAVEMGIWGLLALMRGVPLAHLLARACYPDAVPRTHVETGIALGMQRSSDALIDLTRSAVAEGYRRIKLKIAPEDALMTVGAVRSALGASVPLSVDANGSFRLEDPEHLAVLRKLDEFNLVMIEQPLRPDDVTGHPWLQSIMRTPICLDESISDREDVRRMVGPEACRVVNLKPGRVGGFAESIGIHDLALKSGTALWCGGMLETGIGRAYNVALASLPGFSEPGELSPSARYWTRDVVTPAWTMDAHGLVKVPLDRPGLGVDVDADFMDDCTVRTAVVTAR